MNRLQISAFLLLSCTRAAFADPSSAPPGTLPVIKAMREEISAKPSRVLIAVEDGLTMDEQSACEIVKEAIISTKADAKLVGEIVFTALKHAPAMSAVIVECAMATSPSAAGEIEQAIRRALGERVVNTVSDHGEKSADAEGSETGGRAGSEGGTASEAASGKASSGKGGGVNGPVSVEEEGFPDAFLPGSVGVGGIYLVVPGPAASRCRPGLPCCSGELSPSCLKP